MRCRSHRFPLKHAEFLDSERMLHGALKNLSANLIEFSRRHFEVRWLDDEEIRLGLDSPVLGLKKVSPPQRRGHGFVHWRCDSEPKISTILL